MGVLVLILKRVHSPKLKDATCLYFRQHQPYCYNSVVPRLCSMASVLMDMVLPWASAIMMAASKAPDLIAARTSAAQSLGILNFLGNLVTTIFPPAKYSHKENCVQSTSILREENLGGRMAVMSGVLGQVIAEIGCKIEYTSKA